MRKFEQYPIVVNYNLHTRLRLESLENRLHEAHKFAAERRVSILATSTSDSTIENGLWRPEITQWESTIYRCLQKIDNNPVGRMVLGLINKKTTVWITPKSEKELKECTCAYTGPLNYDLQMDGSYARGAGHGDTVITFDPSLGDDTLFHELVHAYRYSYDKFQPVFMHVQDGRSRGTLKTEEFFAHEMENIYLSHGHRPITMDYTWARVLDKDAIYDYLLDNTELLQALKFFLRHEYLAMLAAHTFNTDYNSFRDFPSLEKKWLEGSSLPELPELGTILQMRATP